MFYGKVKKVLNLANAISSAKQWRRKISLFFAYQNYTTNVLATFLKN